jgi:hypothetical protein
MDDRVASISSIISGGVCEEGATRDKERQLGESVSVLGEAPVGIIISVFCCMA